MDNQYTNSPTVDDDRNQPSSDLAVVEAPEYSPDSLTYVPGVTPVTPASTATRASRFVRVSDFIRNVSKQQGLILGAILLLSIAGLLVGRIMIGDSKQQTNQLAVNDISSKYDIQKVPLEGIAAVGGGISLDASKVAINGALSVNGGLIVTPSLQPSSPTAGQLYYDQETNRLGYYNGSSFVFLEAQQEPVEQRVVQSLGGLSGQIGLGGGLSAIGNQLLNNGVVSFGGQTGAITLGNGLVLGGNVLQNNGVLSLTAGAGIAIADNGNGGFTITNSGSGTGTVSSSGGTVGRIPLFTASQNIEDSILSQSGVTATVNGNLSVTGGLSLSSALAVTNGGTGASSLALNGLLVGNGTGPVSAVTAAGTGLCLLSTAGAPAFAACPSGASGVTLLNGLNGTVTIANASGAGSTITINNASTTAKGIAQFNSTNFTDNGAGVINTAQNINTTATPTFSGVNTNNITPSGALTMGVSAQTALLQGSTTTIRSNGAGNNIILNSANTIELQSSTNVTGNLSVSGDLAVSGGDITSTGSLNVTSGGALTVGASGQSLTLQGNASTSLRSTDGANTTVVGFVNPIANTTLNFPALSAGTYTICTTSGNCSGAAVTLQSAYSNSTQGEIVLDATRGAVSIRDAATPIGANLLEVQNNAGSTTYLAVTTSGVAVTGTATVSGNINSSGGGLATGGQVRVDNTGNLTNIGSLTLSGAISGGTSYSGSGNINTTSGVIQTASTTRIDNSGNLVNIGSISAGGSATFQGGTVTVGTTGQTASLVLHDGNGQTTTLQAGDSSGNLSFILPTGAGNALQCLKKGSGNQLIWDDCDGGSGGPNGVASLNTLFGALTLQGTAGQISVSDDGGDTITLSLDSAVTLQGNTFNGANQLVQLNGSTQLPAVSGALLTNLNATALTVGTVDNARLTNSGALTVTAGTGLSGGGSVALGGSTSLSVAYGSSAGTAVQGNTQITCAAGTGNLTGGGNTITLGTGGSCDSLNTVNNPSFATSVTTPLIQNAGLTLSSTGVNNLLLQTNGNTRLTVTSSGNLTATGSMSLQGGGLTLGADGQAGELTLYDGGSDVSAFTGTLQVAALGSNRTYILPDFSGTSAEICLDTGNCAGSGGGVIGSGTTNRLTKFTSATTIGDSSISDNGSVVTIQGGNLTVGTSSQAASLVLHDGNGQTTTLQAGDAASNLTFVLPTGAGSTYQCLKKGSGNQLIWDNCDGGGGGASGVTSLNTLAGALVLQGTTNQVSVSGNGSDTLTMSLPQNIHTSATPTFSGLTLNGALNMGTNNISGTNFAIQGSTGNLTGGTINGQTISSSANFTGSLTVANGLTLTSGALAVNGGSITSTGALAITPGGALTVGSTSQTLTLRGSGSTSLAAHNGSNSSTLSFTNPTGTNAIILPDASGEVCLTSGNCSGAGQAVDMLNGLLGALTLQGTAGQISVSDDGEDTITLSLDSAVTLQGNTFNGANQLVQLNGSTQLPAVSGALLTNLNATALTVGTVDNARLTNSGALTVTAGTGLSGGGSVALGGSTSLSVAYGSSAGTAVQGNTQITVTAGTNLSGGGTITLGAGGTLSVDVTDSPVFAGDMIVQGGNLALGTVSQIGSLLLHGATGNVTTLQSGNSSGDLTFVLPNEAGTELQCLKKGEGNQLIWDGCFGGSGSSGVTALNSLTGSLTVANATAASGTITINDASTSQKGIAQFNSTNFSASSGTINTIQNIHTSATPTFAGLTLNGALNMGTNNISGTNFAIQGSTGNLTGGTINGQTISSSANFTGSLTVANGLTLTSGILEVNGGSITSTGSLNMISGGPITVGALTNALTLQGNAGSTIVATGGGFATTIGFTGTATGTVNYNFDRAAAPGTYTICTSVGNCSGSAVTLQSAYGNSTNPEIVLDSTRGALTVRDNATPITGNLLEVQDNTGATTYLGVSSAGANIVGNLNITGTGSSSDTTLVVRGNGAQGGYDPIVDIQSYDGVTLHSNARFTNNGGLYLGNDSGKAGSLHMSTGSVYGSIVLDTLTEARTYTMPNASGTVCLQGSTACGFVTGSGAAFVQGGNSFNAAATIGTNDNFDLMLQRNGSTKVTVGADNVTFASGTGLLLQGTMLLQNSADSNFGFEVKTASAQTLFRVDTSARKVAIGAYNDSAADNITGQLQVLPTATGRVGIQVRGNAGYAANYLEAVDDSGNYVFRVQSTGNIISSGGVFSTNPQSAASTGSATATLSSGAVSGSSSNSGNVTIHSGNSTTSGNTGGIVIISGNATSGNSGNVAIDVGTASGTRGTLYLGDQSASAINIGGVSNNPTINIASGTGAINIGTGAQARTISLGTGAAAQTLVLGSTNSTSTTTLQAGSGGIVIGGLSTADNDTVLCRNNSNQLASCSSTFISSVGTLNSQTKSANGAVISGSSLILQTADATSPGMVSTGSQTFAGAKTFTGTTTVRANSDETFRVLNGSGVPVFQVDTSNSRVYVGNPTADANGALLVLDTKNNSGDPTGVNGGMYYNSNSGKFRCYESGTWKDCVGGGGSARLVQLAPEYHGAVISADGSNNTGTMTSDFDGVNVHNYYSWVSSQGSLNDYDVIVRTALPGDYASGFGNFKIWTYGASTSTSNNDIQITVKDASGTACATSVSVLPTSADAWSQRSVSLSGCTYAANDILTVTIRMLSRSNNQVRIGEISYEYTN